MGALINSESWIIFEILRSLHKRSGKAYLPLLKTNRGSGLLRSNLVDFTFSTVCWKQNFSHILYNYSCINQFYKGSNLWWFSSEKLFYKTKKAINVLAISVACFLSRFHSKSPFTGKVVCLMIHSNIYKSILSIER